MTVPLVFVVFFFLNQKPLLKLFPSCRGIDNVDSY